MKDSKYFKKHYEILEPEYDQRQCFNCGYVFMIDYRWTKEVEADDGKLSSKVYCPYCGRKALVRL